jgi:hypothetical protein
VKSVFWCRVTMNPHMPRIDVMILSSQNNIS